MSLIIEVVRVVTAAKWERVWRNERVVGLVKRVEGGAERLGCLLLLMCSLKDFASSSSSQLLLVSFSTIAAPSTFSSPETK